MIGDNLIDRRTNLCHNFSERYVILKEAIPFDVLLSALKACPSVRMSDSFRPSVRPSVCTSDRLSVRQLNRLYGSVLFFFDGHLFPNLDVRIL